MSMTIVNAASERSNSSSFQRGERFEYTGPTAIHEMIVGQGQNVDPCAGNSLGELRTHPVAEGALLSARDPCKRPFKVTHHHPSAVEYRCCGFERVAGALAGDYSTGTTAQHDVADRNKGHYSDLGAFQPLFQLKCAKNVRGL